uniref:Tubulin epsilon and delta complex 1 n=1 Tax=Anser cygnoides TaxID=8845 RepID=A0A8B9EKP0_ANSCY
TTHVLLPLQNSSSFFSRAYFYSSCWFFPSICGLSLCPLVVFFITVLTTLPGTELRLPDTQIRFVKSALWYHGYGRPELYRLPSDGSAGSRELLLAFSWLLHRISLLEQLLARNRVRTGDETSVCMCEDDLSQSEKGTTEIAPEYGPEDRVDVRYLQWLSGRLRFQWRSLHAQHQEQCKLLHKIHLLTTGCHVDQILGHFSVTEMDLIRQPENYKQLVQLLELETMQLEAFLEWKQREPVYWQWMVMTQMNFKGCSLLKSNKENLPCSLFFPPPPSIQVKTRAEDLQKEDFAATVRKIQEAVELKLLDLSNLCAPKKNKMHGLCRLVRSVSKEPAPAVSATEVIRELQMREASLQRELKQLREECRQRLDEIAEGLDGVICISP